MKEYRQKAKMLRAVIQPVRLQILGALVCGPTCVCQLILKTGRRQACISQHLMLLRQTGLVNRTHMGLNMHYELTSESRANLLKCIFHGGEHNSLWPRSQTMLLGEHVKRDVNEMQPIAG